MRRSLERELIRRGLCASLTEARACIDARAVLVSGALANNPARQVDAGEPIELVSAPPFVSRGGEKLAAAIATFAVEIDGKIALDVGASTGGFTDCLLQAGAAHVYAVDVGTNQLHERIRNDPRVTVREQTNVQDLTVRDFASPPEVIVADVSFTSLIAHVPLLLSLGSPDAALILLLKPQFEATRREADRARGVIRDPQIWRRVLLALQSALEEHGAGIMDAMVSPVRGKQGNVEFLLHASRLSTEATTTTPTQLTDDWVDDLLRGLDA